VGAKSKGKKFVSTAAPSEGVPEKKLKEDVIEVIV